MQQLRLVRTTDEALVVSPVDHAIESGPTPQYSLVVDERLRTAVARVPGRRRQGGSPRTVTSMTPRELQARIRSGQSVPDVVEASGMPAEKVDRFAGPVLAERANVAETVRKIGMPSASPADRRPLGDVVDERLRTEADSGSVQWDAWLEQDATWTVQVSWLRESRPLVARWAWHPARRALRPRDGIAEDVARPLPEGDLQSLVRPLRPVQPHGGDLPDVEQVPLAPRSPAAVHGTADGAAPPPAGPPAAPPPAAEPASAAGSSPAAGFPAVPSAAAAASVSSPPVVPGPGSRTDVEQADSPGSPAAGAAGTDEVATEPQEPEEPRRAVGDGRPQPRPRPGAGRRAGGRASVPAWDDILFGTRQQH